MRVRGGEFLVEDLGFLGMEKYFLSAGVAKKEEDEDEMATAILEPHGRSCSMFIHIT